MTDLAALTLQFWNAAQFHRRAPERDQTNVRPVLGNVAIHAAGKLHDRAVELLNEIDRLK